MKPEYQKVLDKFAGVFPVAIVDIATEFGYTIQLFDPIAKYDNVVAAVHYIDKRIIINQNSAPNNTPEKKRFALAHEIGHICNDDGESGNESEIDFMVDIDYPTQEKEINANQFAINLLMPEEAFKKEWGKFFYVFKNDIDMTAHKMRIIFGVSISRVLDRVCELKLAV